MKRYYFVWIVFFILLSVKAQIVTIPDASFKARLLAANGWNHVADNAAGNSMIIDINQDNEIQVSEALLVKKMNVYNSNYIQSLEGIGAFTNLISLDCSYNGLSSLDVSMLPNLKTLDCSRNHISSLNVNGLVNLEELHCFINSLTSLTVNSLTSLKKLECSSNQIVVLNLSGLTNLTEADCSTNVISSLLISSLTSLKKLICSSNQLVNFNPSVLTVLEELNCSNNTNMTSINVNGMNTLTNLNCSVDGLNTIDISSLSNLSSLDCSGNVMSTLNLSGLNNLIYVDCTGCQLNSINFGSISNLQGIHCGNNHLTSLDLHTLINLTNIICSDNQMTQLDVHGLHLLYSFDCRNNLLHTLDMSDNYNLFWFFCSYNLLEYINLKNGTNENAVEIKGNQTLKYICIDESQRDQVYQVLVNTSYFPEYFWYPGQVVLGTYCNFQPGGLTYTVQGNTKFDFNNNGCDATDINFPMKYTITDGIISGDFISNISGSYHEQVPSGTYIITPMLEEPSYYNIYPTSTIVTFPTQTSPFEQNYCITAGGIKKDLEVIILPISRARPGFDATYKLIYRNKGNVAMSGFVKLYFHDNLSDFVSSNPAVATQITDYLTWNFVDILPFETREINIVFNINTPMETDAVNSGDFLGYSATVFPLVNDEKPFDNKNDLKQLVVNSIDPNDKICIEGNSIEPSMIGEYVHYIIRFENTGTYQADNIVVKDTIDTNKFDINTLVPLNGSHSFVTKISNTNQVEFIFENINLPFDDANNDGYVAFKIKTKPNLVVGATFSNSADIFFDYNFPIQTNNFVTTIATLNKPDFAFDSYFILSPNPANDILNFTTKQDIQISSASIYNALGQLVLVITEPHNSIDISSLKTGNYFIKIVSEKGASSGKFIKK
jgi:Leucine-rich repeat (LRR) protein